MINLTLGRDLALVFLRVQNLGSFIRNIYLVAEDPRLYLIQLLAAASFIANDTLFSPFSKRPFSFLI